MCDQGCPLGCTVHPNLLRGLHCKPAAHPANLRLRSGPFATDAASEGPHSRGWTGVVVVRPPLKRGDLITPPLVPLVEPNRRPRAAILHLGAAWSTK
eukprot:scaffold705_cov402-Prasinococcus_capsulatus_cf.AAC.48